MGNSFGQSPSRQPLRQRLRPFAGAANGYDRSPERKLRSRTSLTRPISLDLAFISTHLAQSRLYLCQSRAYLSTISRRSRFMAHLLLLTFAFSFDGGPIHEPLSLFCTFLSRTGKTTLVGLTERGASLARRSVLRAARGGSRRFLRAACAADVVTCGQATRS